VCWVEERESAQILEFLVRAALPDAEKPPALGKNTPRRLPGIRQVLPANH
jgi:hypothetical protein